MMSVVRGQRLDEANILTVACNAIMWVTLNPLVVMYGALATVKTGPCGRWRSDLRVTFDR